VPHAHDLVENNRYLTLATTDTDGHPWASPVYFTADAELRWGGVPPRITTLDSQRRAPQRRRKN